MPAVMLNSPWHATARTGEGGAVTARSPNAPGPTAAVDAPAALAAISAAWATARSRAWALTGEHAANHETGASRPLVVDVDATLVTAQLGEGAGRAHVHARFGFHCRRRPLPVPVPRPGLRRDAGAFS
jgi:hypothetical protein